MMVLANSQIGFCIIILVVEIIIKTQTAESRDPLVGEGIGRQNGTSWWLKKVRINQRATGCWNKPWICKEGDLPPKIKKLCCKNRCVDVTCDVNNCGLCGVRCPITWQCCGGLCIDTNINPFHCGRCDHRCPFLSFCTYGMCGYAQPLPPFPFPFPFPPKPPKPLFPPKLPMPISPPKPPKPFPPKPPRPPLQGSPSG